MYPDRHTRRPGDESPVPHGRSPAVWGWPRGSAPAPRCRSWRGPWSGAARAASAHVVTRPGSSACERQFPAGRVLNRLAVERRVMDRFHASCVWDRVRSRTMRLRCPAPARAIYHSNAARTPTIASISPKPSRTAFTPAAYRAPAATARCNVSSAVSKRTMSRCSMPTSP